MARRKGIPGLSFSWKRALGVSSAKGKLSRQIGIPLTRSGRQQKIGRALGCCVPIFLVLISSLTIAVLIFSGGNVFAHGGGLDKTGGHNNRKEGGYHFHRGPLAGHSYSSKSEAQQEYQKTSPSEGVPLVTSGVTDKLTGTASVIDGDTIEIHGQRIRLHGIDAPESSQTCLTSGEAWRCGAQAANKLSEKINRQTVTCDKRDIDRYGRIVAVCFAGGSDLNAWLVNEGLAVAYRKYSDDYVSQESEAQVAKRGVWGSEFQMPWDWRKAKR